MEEGWLILTIAQWVLIACMGLVLLAHSRLIGLLHMRLGPAGARPLADGPPVGERLDTLSASQLDGSPWVVTFPQRTTTILIFISPQCQTCNALLPHVKDFTRTRPGQSVTLVSTIDDAAMNRAYIAYRRIEGLPYVLGEDLSVRLDIEATPYALRIDEAGTVVAKGVVNTFENLVHFSAQGNSSDPEAGRLSVGIAGADGQAILHEGANR
jgi:methylamine dehydrogenase accessory protein MauD